jgi:hypothetical protein
MSNHEEIVNNVEFINETASIPVVTNYQRKPRKQSKTTTRQSRHNKRDNNTTMRHAINAATVEANQTLAILQLSEHSENIVMNETNSQASELYENNESRNSVPNEIRGDIFTNEKVPNTIRYIYIYISKY